MDYLQNEGELGRREINHHGMKVSVNTSDKKSNKLFSPADSASYVNYLQLCQFAAKKGLPIVLTTFSAVYWSYGLFFYFNPAVWNKNAGIHVEFQWIYRLILLRPRVCVAMSAQCPVASGAVLRGANEPCNCNISEQYLEYLHWLDIYWVSTLTGYLGTDGRRPDLVTAAQVDTATSSSLVSGAVKACSALHRLLSLAQFCLSSGSDPIFC